jgi:hypothetical protein
MNASMGAVAALLAGIVMAACAPSVTTPPTSASPPSTLAPPASTSSAPSPSPTPASAVLIDPDLLAFLPAEVDGLPITENVEAEAATLGDPLLEQVASAFASGFAIEPVSGEFVYAIVVELQPDALDDAVFRDWRDTYDEGACSQANGVLGKAETEIDGRTVYIGTCAGGLRTYHVWLEGSGVLISASAVGERRLGELLVENLRP